jgi:uncharacterized protein YyaL (SSP411 family)
MRAPVLISGAALLAALAASADEAQPGLLRHSQEWVQERMQQMVAVDDAYIWHEVLGGRAIHQNSMTDPPTEPNEGNFHTQQQAFYASVKMDLYDLGGRKETRHLDDARGLLGWVVQNGYDEEQRQFYLKYNRRSGEWDKSFHPEFNMMSVSALLRYDTYRPSPAFVGAAETALGRIVETGAFKADQPKSLYGSSYLALKLLDAYDSTGQERFLTSAREVTDLANQTMWDAEYGGWFYAGNPQGGLPNHTVKFTHTNANMIQACFRLHLLGNGDQYREYATEALDFLADHSRSPDGGWYRHNTRDGSDPTQPPIVGDGGTTGTGAVCVYDRMAQVMVACCLGYRATEDPRYLRWIDETLDKMEQTHLTKYPVGVNYGYISAGDYQNTWCHLWGLKAMIAITELWREFG